MENVVAALTAFVLRRPLAVIVGSLLLCAGLMTGIGNFRIEASVKRFIGEDHPMVVHLNELEAEYIDDSNIFIMVKPDEGTVFTKATLTAIREMTTAAWQIPNLRRVDSLTNFQHTRVDGDELTVEDLVGDDSSLEPADLARIRNIALQETRLAGLLVATDGRAAGLNMLFSIDASDDVQRFATADAVAEIKADISRRYPDIELYEAGFVSMMHQMTETAAADARSLYTFSLVLIMGFLLWFFRSLSNTLVVILVGALSVAASIGFFGLIGGYLTPPTALGVLMVLTLALADGIHVVKSTRKYLGEGATKREAIQRGVVRNFTAIGLTSITTAIGFISFNFNDFVGIQMLGNYVAFGVMLAFLLSITLLPALLCYCRLSPELYKTSGLSYEALAVRVIRYHRILLIGSALLLLLSSYCISLNELDDSITRHVKPSHPLRQQARQIESDLTGSIYAIYNFRSDSADGVTDLAYMRKVKEFSDWAKGQPGVRHVSAYTDILQQLNQDLNGGISQLYELPASTELAAQYLLLYELSLPYGLELSNQINFDKTATRVVITTDDFTIRQTNDFVRRNRQWLSMHAPEFDSFANSSVLSSNLTVEASIWKTLSGALLAIAIIAVVLICTFRALVPGLLCVLTVVAPMLFSFGLWGLSVGVIDLPATLALCMVIGISIDFSVHFISRYLYARRSLKLNLEQGIVHTFTNVASPILTSTLTLGAGFLVMVLGQFQFGARMGLLTSLCIVMSLLTVFTVLPSLLVLGRGRFVKI
jgi:uncharacterized protein